MTTRRWHKLAMLHKIEAAYANDASPAAADAIVASNITFTPFQAEEVQRDLILPFSGNQGKLLAGEHGRIEFDVEVAGAGAAGDVPRYGSLLRASGFAETVSAGVEVVYSPVDDAVESGTLYFNSDGVQHVFVGVRANLQMTYNAKGIPHFRLSMVGLLGQVTDVALPAVTKAGWVDAVLVNKANTVLSLHGWTAVAESISFNMGNEVTPRFLIGEEEVLITDRKVSGTVVVKAATMAEIDWFAIVRARTRGALTLTQGTVAGNIVEIGAAAVEIGTPTQGQTDKIVNYSLPLELCPANGLDELIITVR